MVSVRVRRARGGLDFVVCGQSRDEAARLAGRYAERGLEVRVEPEPADEVCAECGGEGFVLGDPTMGVWLDECPRCTPWA